MIGKDLSVILQKVQSGFAYQLLALQIEVQDDTVATQPKITTISRLIQLYMMAVEALECKSDKRYKHFNNKIQSLMKKKHIIEELHIASTGKSADKSAMQQVIKAEIGQRKNQLDLQILLNRDQFDSKKIKQMMQNSQNKIKIMEKNVTNNLKKQDDILQQRRKIRKLKSQTGSISKFNSNLNKFQSPTKILKSQKQLDDYFGMPTQPSKFKPGTKRTGSTEKHPTVETIINNKLNNGKLKALVV